MCSHVCTFMQCVFLCVHMYEVCVFLCMYMHECVCMCVCAQDQVRVNLGLLKCCPPRFPS